MDDITAIASTAAVCLGFAFIHSACVTDFAKRAIVGLFGDRFVRGLYRLIYTTMSAITTAAAIWLIILIPDERIWAAPVWLAYIMHGVQLLGLLIGYMAMGHFSSKEFMGLRQAIAYFKGEDIGGDIEGMTAATRLIKTGLYGIVRNPMYLAGILIFSFEPNITRNWLTVSVLADLYFIFGAVVESRRMAKRFGPEYVEYSKNVPLLFPRPAAILALLRRG